MTFWSDVTLKKRLPGLIDIYSPEYVQGASYELGIGREVYVTPDHQAKAAERVKKKMSYGDSVNIPRGQFAFLITNERITVPDDSVAFISIKAKIKFKGLVNISGFHVDPGYQGRLVFSVFNAGASDVVLDYNERAFLIWYASLDQRSETPRKGVGYMNIPSDLVNGISDDTLSMAILDDKLKTVTNRVNAIYIIAAALGGIIGLVKALGFSMSPAAPVTAPPSLEPKVEKVYLLPQSDFSYPPRFDYLDCSLLMAKQAANNKCN